MDLALSFSGECVCFETLSTSDINSIIWLSAMANFIMYILLLLNLVENSNQYHSKLKEIIMICINVSIFPLDYSNNVDDLD